MWILLVGIFASAQNSFPEYVSLQESEVEQLDNPREVDSEYESDLLTYRFQISDNKRFLASPAGAELSVGSLSSKKFAHYERAQLRKHQKNLLARFTYFNEQDLDQRQLHAIFEMAYALPSATIAVYGEPSHFKRQNDFGIATSLRIWQQELRIFHTWIDFTRRDHNDQPDGFRTGHEARSFGVLGQSRHGDGSDNASGDVKNDIYYRYWARFEPRVEWVRPQSSLEYEFSRSEIGGESLWQSLQMRFVFTEKFEAFKYFNGVLESMRTQNLAVELRQSIGDWLPGFAWRSRNYSSHAGKLDQVNYQPFLERKFTLNEQQFFQLGYELTIFQATGDSVLKAEGLPQMMDEHRLNTQWHYTLEDLELRATLTWDLDSIARNTGLFEGGHGFVRMAF